MQGLLDLYSAPTHATLPTDKPYFIFSGDQDPIGSYGKGVIKLVKALQSYGAEVTHKLYHEGRHEMLNELNKAEVYRDIIQWIHKTVPIIKTDNQHSTSTAVA